MFKEFLISCVVLILSYLVYQNHIKQVVPPPKPPPTPNPEIGILKTDVSKLRSDVSKMYSMVEKISKKHALPPKGHTAIPAHLNQSMQRKSIIIFTYVLFLLTRT